MRHGCDGKLTGLVRVAKQKFARRKRRPCLSIIEELTLSRLRTAFDAEVLRIAEAVGEAKVLARRRLAVADLGCGILFPNQCCAARLVQCRLNRSLAGVERLDCLTVDAQPEVDMIFVPEGIPAIRRR